MSNYIFIAILYSFYDNITYIKQLHLFAIEQNKIYKLIKALYKLKQTLYI